MPWLPVHERVGQFTLGFIQIAPDHVHAGHENIHLKAETVNAIGIASVPARCDVAFILRKFVLHFSHRIDRELMAFAFFVDRCRGVHCEQLISASNKRADREICRVNVSVKWKCK